MPGRMDAAQASPVSAWMAVSREQNDYPLVPLICSWLDRSQVQEERNALPAPGSGAASGKVIWRRALKTEPGLQQKGGMRVGDELMRNPFHQCACG
jgi:hypothetical protein